jgi:hypothetical protein
MFNRGTRLVVAMSGRFVASGSYRHDTESDNLAIGLARLLKYFEHEYLVVFVGNLRVRVLRGQVSDESIEHRWEKADLVLFHIVHRRYRCWAWPGSLICASAQHSAVTPTVSAVASAFHHQIVYIMSHP